MPPNESTAKPSLSLKDLMTLFANAIRDPKATIQSLSARLVVLVGHVHRIALRVDALDKQIAELSEMVMIVYQAAQGAIPRTAAPEEPSEENDPEAEAMAAKVLAETEAEAGVTPPAAPTKPIINRAEAAAKAALARQGKTLNNGAEPKEPA